MFYIKLIRKLYVAISDPHKMQNVGLNSACLRNCLYFQYQWIRIEYIDYKYCQECFYANLSHHFLLSCKLSGIFEPNLRVPPFLKMATNSRGHR